MLTAARMLVKVSRAIANVHVAAALLAVSPVVVIACSSSDGTSVNPGGPSSPDPVVDASGPDTSREDAVVAPPGAIVPTTPIGMTANRAWQWVPEPEARCIDDSPTGFGVNFDIASSDKLMIYFDGGGLCFTAETCENNTANRDGFGEAELDAQVRSVDRRYLNRDASNPMRDYNMAYIPYCTGDLHAGDNDEGLTFNGRTYRFHGYPNATRYLSRILATWPDVKTLMIMGPSAGGYGATFNFERIQRAWSRAQTILVNDSGTFIGDDGFAPCMQAAMRDAYRFDRTAMATCPDCLANANGSDTFARWFDHVLALPSSARIGFLSTTQDVALRQLASVGRSAACDLSNVFLFPPADATVAMGSLLARTRSSKLVTFIVESEAHTLIGSPQTTLGGITLQSWLEASLVGGSAFTDLGP